MASKGLLVVYTGCSGVGKGTMMNEFLKRDDSCVMSVSATTRKPRPGEQDGVEYYFLDRKDFEARIENGDFLEYAEYCGNYYGTPKAPVEKMISEGKNVILEIEVEGGTQVKNLAPDSVSVFIVPPSMEELERRLRGRGTESDEVISERLAAAERELTYAPKYDYRVINDDVNRAVDEVLAIIHKEKARHS